MDCINTVRCWLTTLSKAAMIKSYESAAFWLVSTPGGGTGKYGALACPWFRD